MAGESPRSGAKRSSGGTRKPATAKRSSSAKPANKSTARKPASRNGSGARKTAAASSRSRSTASRSTASKTSNASNASNGGIVDTVKGTATKVKGPVVAVGAAAAGLAGGLALKSRGRRKTVLGVKLPKSFGKSGVPEIDPKAIAKTVGDASKRFAKTSKSVSKDLQRAGDQAEKIGKILD